MPSDSSPGFTLVDPASVGLDPARLRRVDDFIRTRYLDTGRYAGFSLLVSRRGQVAHVSTQGQRSAETGAPMTADTIVRIYSMTKPVTSVALLSLYEEGLFRLDQPVSTFIPSWSDLRVWRDGTPTNYSTDHPEREMTVRDLLTHTSGLTYAWMQRHPVDAIYRDKGVDQPRKLEDWVETLAGIPLVFSPGTRWSYSVATDVVGRLVEIISGLPLDAFLAQRIFGPLGMTDTAFGVEEAKADRFAANYTVPALSPWVVPPGAEGDEKVLLDDGGPGTQFRLRPTFLSGGGGLTSTLVDYERFTRMLVSGGALEGVRILGRKTVRYATSNHLPGGRDLAAMGQPVFSETNYDGVGFGLGFSVVVDPAAAQILCSAGEYGWGGAASTLFWIDPTEELVVIGLAQLMPSSAYPIRQELRPLIHSALVD